MKKGRIIVWTAMAIAACSMVASASTGTGPVHDDLQPGSVLVFPKFDTSPDWSTKLAITNTHPSASVDVQINYVCPAFDDDEYCPALDRHITITSYGTAWIDVAAHHPPCNKGFVVAFADTAKIDGKPRAFDHLIGSTHISFAGNRAMGAQAIAIQSVNGPAGDNLVFDGNEYRALPSHLFTDFKGYVPGDQGGQGSKLSLLTLDTVAGGYNPVTHVEIDFFNKDEMPFSTSYSYICWGHAFLHEIDINFTAGEGFLGSDHGSLVIWPTAKCPIAGGCPPLETFDPAILGSIVNYDNAAGYLTLRNLYHDANPKRTTFVPR